MLSRLTYGVIFTAIMIIFSSSPCYAPTDWVVNTIDYANGLVKDASAIQEEYASYANTYIQGKVGELGDVNAVKKKTEKAKKIKDRYNKAQEKYSKAKALAEKAKEKKEALTKKAEELKAKADDLKKKYDDAMEKVNEAKEKIDEAKEKVEEAKEKVEEGKEALANAKDSAEALKDTASGAVDAAQAKVSGTIDAAKEKAGMSPDAETKADAGVSAVEDQPGAAESVAEEDVEAEEGEIQEVITETTPRTSPTSSEQALMAIQALATTQEGVSTDIVMPTTTASPQMISSISADEVLELREIQDTAVAQVPEATSKFNLEEQLLMSDELKAKERKENAAPQLTVEALKKELKAGDEAKLKSLRESRRQSFGSSSKAVKENANEQ